MTPVGQEQVKERVPRGTYELLTTYVDLLIAENDAQNLVSAATMEVIWERHILDSLQLLDLSNPEGSWADIGSGAGLPGLVVALTSTRAVVLIEPRRKRAAFLTDAVKRLGVEDRVEIIAKRAESVTMSPPAVISARAVASLDGIFAMAEHFSNRATRWILPKGRSAAEEVAKASEAWQGEFRLIPSVTEPDSAIVVAQDIRRRGQP